MGSMLSKEQGITVLGVCVVYDFVEASQVCVCVCPVHPYCDIPFIVRVRKHMKGDIHVYLVVLRVILCMCASTHVYVCVFNVIRTYDILCKTCTCMCICVFVCVCVCVCV